MSQPAPQRVTVRGAVVEVFDQAPNTNDASDMYVLYVRGASVLVRERLVDPGNPAAGTELFVHIENEDRAQSTLVLDVNNAGETSYRF